MKSLYPSKKERHTADASVVIPKRRSFPRACTTTLRKREVIISSSPVTHSQPRERFSWAGSTTGSQHLEGFSITWRSVKLQIPKPNLPEGLKNYGLRFVTLYRRQWSRPSQRKRNAKRQNGCFEEALQRAEKRTERQRRKGKIIPFECRVPKNSKERLESLPQWSVQRNRGKQ